MAPRPCARLWATGEGETLMCKNPVGSVTSDRWAQEVLCIYHLGVGPERDADTE